MYSANTPQRPADLARLELTKLRIEDGVTLETVYRSVTETAASTLNVERVGVWLWLESQQTLRCADLFERSKDTHSAGSMLQVSDFPDYWAALKQRKTIPVEVAAIDPRTSALAEAYLTPLGITSVLDAPILIGGEIVGVVRHEHVGTPREWTTEDRDFAGSMADLLALNIRAAEMEEAKVALHTQSNQLAEARQLDSLAEMAAGVAHDFNNILTVVIGRAELILLNPAAPTVAEYARQIAEAGMRGTALAKDIMTFARPGARSSRVIRPGDVIKAMMPVLQGAVGDGHRITFDLSTVAGRVLIAPDQLERLILNLVVNARDAMPDGGEIRVTLQAIEGHAVEGKQGRYCLIEVNDHGTGIPPDVLGSIFEPFFTTKPRGQGTGLGLAVVNQIVSYVGGFIRVETAVGNGATFRVYLPWVSSHG